MSSEMDDGGGEQLSLHSTETPTTYWSEINFTPDSRTEGQRSSVRWHQWPQVSNLHASIHQRLCSYAAKLIIHRVPVRPVRVMGVCPKGWEHPEQADPVQSSGRWVPRKNPQTRRERQHLFCWQSNIVGNIKVLGHEEERGFVTFIFFKAETLLLIKLSSLLLKCSFSSVLYWCISQ